MSTSLSREKPYALKKGEGRRCSFGIDFVIKASEIAIGSGTAVMEYETVKGEEPPDHSHPTEDEMFYVLHGKIQFRCAAQTFELSAGDFIFLPSNIEHGYTVLSDEPVRLLVITSPVRQQVTGGWGGFAGDMEKSG